VLACIGLTNHCVTSKRDRRVQLISDRPGLQRREGQRAQYSAYVERFGIKRSFGYETQTVLLTDGKHAGRELVADHLWMARGKWARTLIPGIRILFYARMTPYVKGYAGENINIIVERGHGVTESHRLSRPTKVQII